ncbi:hypothetical protein DPMN_033894 [Dreissena polymorpha]|uniref:Uncharacterized protein n=1 Tax=Dreissena polymorpha TaxID=45954 RepID=A0A9D4RKB8_DREPO|nr:hypothetical protein DPMN_033894 [Dreissena polymorpha]
MKSLLERSFDRSSDQLLMRSIKSVEGLTRGRGITEAQRAHCLLSVPATAEINRAMQDFTDQKVETSERSENLTRQKRQNYA